MNAFSPETYRDAALARKNVAVELLKSKNYVECIYMCGVSVECILLSMIRLSKAQWSSRHGLLALMAESDVKRWIICEPTTFDAKMTAIFQVWKNDLRYISAGVLKHRYLRAGLDKIGTKRIKGDLLEFNAKKAYDAAGFLVNEGAKAWLKKVKKSQQS